MSKMIKHSFEAVSLLTRGNGMLDVTIIPALNQPDWLLPSALILEVSESHHRAAQYLWQQQQIAVFGLVPVGQAVDKVIIIEGNTMSHRLALQTKGELRHIQVRISDVKDEETTKRSNDGDSMQHADDSNNTQKVIDTDYFDENLVSSYLFQTVIVDGESLIVPDLDKIAYHLIDLNDK